MARILVIEDEKDLRGVLEWNLKQARHDVLTASCGADGLRIARRELPDLVLLDLMLPDMSGMEICRTLKQDPLTRGKAVVILTAKGEEVDRIVGLELGADDYVVKPFSVRELLLRIGAVLRRAEGAGQPASEARLELGSLLIDRDAHRVWVTGEEIDLTAVEFRLLIALCTRRGRVQSRSALLAEVWQMDADIETRTVDTHVKRLREKLGSAGDYVQTVRGVGYRFDEAG